MPCFLICDILELEILDFGKHLNKSSNSFNTKNIIWACKTNISNLSFLCNLYSINIFNPYLYLTLDSCTFWIHKYNKSSVSSAVVNIYYINFHRTLSTINFMSLSSRNNWSPFLVLISQCAFVTIYQTLANIS